MKNLKGNNKGFSLVELIVVIAIMGILAVTLAPRLTQYIEKARKGSDKEVVTTLTTAAKLADAEYPLTANSYPLGGTADTLYIVGADVRDTWTLDVDYAAADDQEFWDTMIEAISSFTLKSSDVSETTQITLIKTSSGDITVSLVY